MSGLRPYALVLTAVLLGTACGSSTLREVRAREPEFRLAGVAASRQLEVARCIRDALEQQGVGEDSSILQEIERAPDGMHVVGRPDGSLSSGVFYDVAIREDAVLAMMAPNSVLSPDPLRHAITVCVGAKGEQTR